MRQIEVGPVDHDVAHQDEVQIEGPRRPGVRPFAAALPFYPHERLQQHLRRARAPARYCAIEIIRLRRNPDRQRLDERGYAHVGEQLTEGADRE